MSIETIKQASKTLIESAYSYENLEKNKKAKKQIQKTKEYMIKICKNIQKTIKEEKENV